jgi:CheY-like chemotaxis protein
MAVVVVVDDDTDMAGFVTITLELAGHTVHTALDGPTALSMVRTYRPQLVLMDNHMPGLTGVEVAQTIRADPNLQHIPIVMVSGDSNVETQGAVDRLLAKPLRPRELTTVIKEFLPPEPANGAQ